MGVSTAECMYAVTLGSAPAYTTANIELKMPLNISQNGNTKNYLDSIRFLSYAHLKGG